jgi:hypothetical protein
MRPVLRGPRGSPGWPDSLDFTDPPRLVRTQEADVRPVLHGRFDMAAWFKRHGLPVELITSEAAAAAGREREEHMAAALGLLLPPLAAPCMGAAAQGLAAPPADCVASATGARGVPGGMVCVWGEGGGGGGGCSGCESRRAVRVCESKEPAGRRLGPRLAHA